MGYQSDEHLTGISVIGQPPAYICSKRNVMNTDNPHSVLLSAHSAVLLIFFMPSEVTNRPERSVLTALADSVQAKLGSLVRVLRIDETDHPDVVQSFAITQLPAFVLVRKGIELWRQQGLSDETTLVEVIRGLLATYPSKDQLPA
jgi:thioredoxin-like negative regulator of GroEL